MKTYIPHLQKFHSVELSKKVKKLQKKKKKNVESLCCSSLKQKAELFA